MNIFNITRKQLITWYYLVKLFAVIFGEVNINMTHSQIFFLFFLNSFVYRFFVYFL